MNLVQSILELKQKNRDLHNATKAEGKELLRDMMEYIEKMEVPEIIGEKESVQVINIIKKADHSIMN